MKRILITGGLGFYWVCFNQAFDYTYGTQGIEY